MSAAIALLKHLRSALGPSLSAFEVIFPNVYDGVLSLTGVQPPVASGSGMYALVEMQGQDEAGDNERFSQALMACYESGIVTDVAVSGSLREYHAIWKLREAASEFIFSMDHVSGFDVSLPLSSMQLSWMLRAPRLRPLIRMPKSIFSAISVMAICIFLSARITMSGSPT